MFLQEFSAPFWLVWSVSGLLTQTRPKWAWRASEMLFRYVTYFYFSAIDKEFKRLAMRFAKSDCGYLLASYAAYYYWL